MALINSSDTPWQNTTWTGFLFGALAGFAASSLLVGLVVGYSVSGGSLGMPSGGTVAGTQPTPSVPTIPPEPSAPGKAVAPVTSRDHVLGNPKAKITVIEYSDFECPFCKRHAPTVTKLIELYKDDVNIVYRHFPLSFHQSAQKLAEASECVADIAGNDAFWKFHDAVFALGTVSDSYEVVGPLAKAAGADEAKFKTCFESDKFAKYVQDQMQEGIESGVQGTPGNFIVNNDTKETKEVSGAVPVTTFQTTIDGMLGKN